MDGRVSARVRGSKGLPFFPVIVQSLKTRGRIIPILGSIPSHCQCGLDQKRRQAAKVCVLRQPGASWCKGKVSTNGEARVHFSYSNLQAQAILLSPHGDHPD